MSDKKTSLNVAKSPPSRSKTIFSDAWYFLFKKPEIKTLIKFDSEEKRNEYNQRVMQRVGIDVNKNTILNIHQIGVEAPVSYVFNELLNWNGSRF